MTNKIVILENSVELYEHYINDQKWERTLSFKRGGVTYLISNGTIKFYAYIDYLYRNCIMSMQLPLYIVDEKRGIDGEYSDIDEIIEVLDPIFPSNDISAELDYYLTKVEAAETYQPIGDYLTKASADTLYQPIGDYVTDEELVEALDDYYTKDEADEKFQEKLIAGDNITISGNVISAVGGSGSTGCNCDLSDYVTFEDLNELVGDVYTKTEVNNLFVTKTTFNTYITNLQQQINSLIEAISGCCGSTGETEYRWITMTGASDYTCSGTTKMTKEKQQSSTDGINWTDTGQYRTGSSVIQYNSTDCGYEGCVVLSAYTSNGNIITPNTHEQIEGSITPKTTKQGNMYNNREIITSITVSDCVNTIGSAAGNDLFYGYTNLTTVILPSTITRIHPNALVWNSGTNITCYAMTPPFMSDGYHYFYTGGRLKIYVPASVVDTYKTANGWSQYANIIYPIS